jgi:hypothetical protein
LLALLAPALLQVPSVEAAPFAARATPSDPPTGDNTTVDLTSVEEPLTRGSGIRWSIAPWRWAEKVADMRSTRRVGVAHKQRRDRE